MSSKSQSSGGKEKSKSSGSKSKSKSSSKSPKRSEPEYAEIPPVVLKNVRSKGVSTFPDLPDYVFENFRCPRCCLVLNHFQDFINHSCWRKYYASRYHLGSTQTFACRECNCVFYSQADYTSHRCSSSKSCDLPKWLTLEEVIPITYRQHQDYYINWVRRSEREGLPHEPDYNFLCRCCKCSGKFKSKLEFLLHSCCLFTVLNPAELKRLKTCMCCKFVFINEDEYNKHVNYCNIKRAFCIDFDLKTPEIACQQFVIGRHCFDFDFHLHNQGTPGLINTNKSPITNCPVCSSEFTDLLEFLYHPCVAGRRLTPFNLELILLCCECSCLFIDVFECLEHLKSCSPVSFAFIRITAPELLKVILRRWSKEMDEHPYLPSRQDKFRCGDCEEIFREFGCFLEHSCPKRERYERLFIQPLGIMETFSCNACHLVVFSITEAIEHSRNCRQSCYPQMVQIHYTLNETVAALEPWMKCPHSLKFDVAIGARRMDDDEKKLMNSEVPAKNKYDTQKDVVRRLEIWISGTIFKRMEEKVKHRDEILAKSYERGISLNE